MMNLRRLTLSGLLLLAACPPGTGVDAGERDAGAPTTLDGWVDAGCKVFLTDAGLQTAFPNGRLADGGFAFVDEAGAPFDPGPFTAIPQLACFETISVRLPRPQSPAPIGGKEYFRGCATMDEACPVADGGSDDLFRGEPGYAQPFNPFGFTWDAGSEPSAGTCLAGQAWSFEGGSYSPWVGTGVFHTNTAIYGNAVSIFRINPPGFIGNPTTGLDPLSTVGGDYWEFSRSIGYHGNWWAGSGDARYGWHSRPGMRLNEALGGDLVSPPFAISTPYVSFLIGGHRNSGQRVELLVRSTPNNHEQLKVTYRGLGIEELAPGPAVDPSPSPDWVVVRASTSLRNNDYLERRVVWDVSQYQAQNLQARFRVVDVAGDKTTINVDDFRCEAAAPVGTQWLATDAGAPVIGEVRNAIPIWGGTDTHAHLVSNLTVGGHYVWGDVDDPLENIYNCNAPLPEIKDLRGAVKRAAIPDPNYTEQCFVSAGVIALINGVGGTACSLAAATVGIVPFVGPFIAVATLSACAFALSTATAALLTIPSVTTTSLHGATMPTSGGLKPGPFIEFIVSLIENKRMLVHGLIEQQDWDTLDGTHSGFGATYLHQRYHKTMLRRAFQGGLRLMVVDALHSRALQYVLDGRDDMDDWDAIRITVDAMRRLTAGPSDPTYPRGALFDIAEIALSPGQARDIISRNKMAIILGTETQELGKLRPDVPGDSMERQVADLFAMGIRKVTAIHGANNPLGGTGFFNDIYNAGGVYNNLTINGAGSTGDGEWKPLLDVPVFLPSSAPPPLGGLPLGSYQVLHRLTPVAPCVGASCPWNLRNDAWFEVTDATSGDDFIGGVSDIAFRVGVDGAKKGRTLAEHNPFTEPEFQWANKLDSLSWLLGRGPGGHVPSRRCSLDGMFFPMLGELPEGPRTNYSAHPGGQLNVQGLSASGVAFAREMMKRGMIVDTDHLGQQSRLDLHRALAAFRNEASPTWPTEQYPVLGIHSDVRTFGRHGPAPVGTPEADTHGWGAETDKTVAEVEVVRRNGGALSPGFNGNVIDDPLALVGNQVRNNCDYSTKPFAVKYLQMVRLMGGRGVTTSTDNNSPSPKLVSRFGTGTACFSSDSPERLKGERDEDGPLLASWPRDWDSAAVARGCRFNSAALPGEQVAGCASTDNPKAQLREWNGVEYEDYATSPRRSAPWRPAGRSELELVVARREGERRDDGAQLAAVAQLVAYGGGGELRQLRPMKKFRNDGVAVPASANTGWDVNLDGFANQGLMPDVWQDMRNVGVSWEQLGPMFNAAGDFIDTWERSCRLQAQWHATNGTVPLAGCD